MVNELKQESIRKLNFKNENLKDDLLEMLDFKFKLYGIEEAWTPDWFFGDAEKLKTLYVMIPDRYSARESCMIVMDISNLLRLGFSDDEPLDVMAMKRVEMEKYVDKSEMLKMYDKGDFYIYTGRNAWEEASSVLKNNGKTLDDVMWVGSTYAKIPFSLFIKLLDINYMDNCLPMDLIVCGDGWWLEREDKCDNGFWRFRALPTQPDNFVKPESLLMDAAVMKKTLEELCKKEGIELEPTEYNESTLAAFKEAEEIRKGNIKATVYTTMEELIKSWEMDEDEDE